MILDHHVSASKNRAKTSAVSRVFQRLLLLDAPEHVSKRKASLIETQSISNPILAKYL